MASKPLPEIVRWSQELFAPLGSLRTKAMFGGWGFYCDELFFALIADEVLYLKADDEESQARFKAAGSAPFRYTYADGRTVTMGYWSAPEEAMDSPNAMLPWARAALACALRAGAKTRRK
ncbi:TfoX/Sxy family protein [Denitratisoma sp. agr-D3]